MHKIYYYAIAVTVATAPLLVALHFIVLEQKVAEECKKGK